MGIYYNNTEISDIYYNGTEVTSVYYNGTEIWTKEEQETSLGKSIADYAMMFIGCPYVYGGAGPQSFDVPRFIVFVFKNFGMSLPTSVNALKETGTTIKYDNMQPGDIVFWSTVAGIYVGEGLIIWASPSKGEVTTLFRSDVEITLCKRVWE